jgi:hypothetical protein
MDSTDARFIRRENVKRFRNILSQTSNEDERIRVQKLLAKEERKQIEAGDFGVTGAK